MEQQHQSHNGDNGNERLLEFFQKKHVTSFSLIRAGTGILHSVTIPADPEGFTIKDIRRKPNSTDAPLLATGAIPRRKLTDITFF